MLAGRKYKAMWKLLASTQYESPFEITKDVRRFVQEYKLERDFDKKKIDGEEEGKLKQRIANDLLRISTVFVQENPTKERRLQEVKSAIRAEILQLYKAKNPDLNVYPEIEVDIRKETTAGTDYWNVYLMMSLDGSAVEKDLESLRYSIDPAERIVEMSENWSWCAWLGIPESPFFDEAFVEGFAEDQASIALEHFYRIRNEGKYFDEVNEAIRELVDGHKGNE